MRLDYQQTYKEEILVEFASSVYAQVVNLVVEHKLNIHDENHFLVHLMHQFGNHRRSFFGRTRDNSRILANYE